MFKNLTIYRLAPGRLPAFAAMESALQSVPFAPCFSAQHWSVGWVPPRGDTHGALLESVAGQWIARLMIENKTVPAAMVRKRAQAEAAKIEADTGRKPGKKEMKALREDAYSALLPQAFPKSTDVWIWIDPAAGLLMTDAASQSALDHVGIELMRAFDGLTLAPLQTIMTPQTALTQWLVTQSPGDDWPGEFSIERACELVSCNEEKSVVKFNRHNLVSEEVREHIAQGKLPKWAAMSYAGRVSFVLDGSMRLKKIAYLDGVFDGRSAEGADGFDADVALATGELQKLIPDLIDALGGELTTN